MLKVMVMSLQLPPWIQFLRLLKILNIKNPQNDQNVMIKSRDEKSVEFFISPLIDISHNWEHVESRHEFVGEIALGPSDH